MVASSERVREVAQSYIHLVANGTSEEIVALYAEDATVEDPVGSDPLHGHDAIRAFYAALDPLRIETSLFAMRTVPGTAVFHFEIVTHTDDFTVTVAPIEVMTFDDEGRITSMKAYWGEADMHME